MATNHVLRIKERALEVITQPDSPPLIRDIPTAKRFNYPEAKADMTAEQLGRVFGKIEKLAALETADLLARVMVRH